MDRELYLNDFIEINETIYKMEEVHRVAMDSLESLDIPETLNHINHIAELYNQIKRFHPYLYKLYPHYTKVFKGLDKVSWNLKAHRYEKTI